MAAWILWLWVLWLWVLWLWAPRRGGVCASRRFFVDLGPLLSVVEGTLRAARAGDVTPVSVAAEKFPGIGRVLAKAQTAGRPLAASLQALKEATRSAQQEVLARRRLGNLFATRLLLGLGLSALFASYLGTERADILPGIAGAVVVTASFWILRRYLPSSWLLAERPAEGFDPLSSDAVAWFHQHVMDEAVAGMTFECDAELEALKLQEILRGVTLREERFNRLADYVVEKSAAFAERLQRFEDFLPLLELGGIGLPVVLVLVGPVSRWLG